MSELAKQSFSVTGERPPGIQSLILGRLALIFLVIFLGFLWVSKYQNLQIEALAAKASLLIIISAALSGAYLIAFYLNESYGWQIRIQFLIDAFLITLIVSETGRVISPYTTLYLVLISVAGVFSSKLETISIALISACCFAGVSFLSAGSFTYNFSGESVSGGLTQILSFNSIGILIVGLLAGHLSDRRKFSKKLKETTESFVNLHALHENIVESIRSGLITTSRQGIIYTFNSAAAAISGIRAERMPGASIFSVFAEESHPAINACLTRAIEGRSFPTRHFEAVIRPSIKKDQDARRTTVACSALPLIGQGGEVTGLILTFQDITEIRAMEESLRRSDRLAAVGRMAAGLAHEIRNPLGSMSSALQFLQENPAPAGENLIDVVLSESERLDRIITNFLSYANPAADIFSADEFGEMDIKQALSECLVLLRHGPEFKEGHQLKLDMPDRPVIIRANETQIKQVFWNILRNSLQAMPAGGQLKITCTEFAGHSLKLIFEDTGNGIGPAQLKHLFEPFTSSNGGSGLGLSIVRRIISNHQGQIEVENREDVGTRVVIELPLDLTK